VVRRGGQENLLDREVRRGIKAETERRAGGNAARQERKTAKFELGAGH